MKLHVITTGGTIDKVYFDAKSEYEVGEPQVQDIFRGAQVTFDFTLESVLRKDSLELTDADRLVLVLLLGIGVAVGAVQALPPGVYLAMNGRVFDPKRARKNRERNCFEEAHERA